jgi:hypothetical protein
MLNTSMISLRVAVVVLVAAPLGALAQSAGH